MRSYKRSTRVSELLQQEISRIVQEIKNPDLGFVTITSVKITDDLQDARVFYSVIGSKEEVKRTGVILNQSLKFIRQQIAEKVNLRRTPSLALEYDDTPEKANRIFEIIEKIHKEEEKT